MEIKGVIEFYQEMGDLIKMERTRKSMSQEMMAGKLDLTRTSVMNIEKGRHRPSIHQLLQIANILEVNFIELIPNGRQNDVRQQTDVSAALDNAIFDQTSLPKEAQSAVHSFLSDQKK